jgi:hypothetical protein
VLFCQRSLKIRNVESGDYVAIIEAHTSLSLAILWDLQQINRKKKGNNLIQMGCSKNTDRNLPHLNQLSPQDRGVYQPPIAKLVNMLLVFSLVWSKEFPIEHSGHKKRIRPGKRKKRSSKVCK